MTQVHRLQVQYSYLNVSGSTQPGTHSRTEDLFTAERSKRKLMHVVSQVARIARWTAECRHACTVFKHSLILTYVNTVIVS